MAGGFKVFGPTYNATKWVRVTHEGMINGNHDVDPNLVDLNDQTKLTLAGKIVKIGQEGITLAGEGGSGAIGLCVEDIEDMVNASLKASFYFRGGEYYVHSSRLGNGFDLIQPGDDLTTDDEGRLIKKVDANHKTVAVAVTVPQEFKMGNMYDNAGEAANGGLFVGIILHV